MTDPAVSPTSFQDGHHTVHGWCSPCGTVDGLTKPLPEENWALYPMKEEDGAKNSI